MKSKILILTVAAASLAGCSNVPSNSEILKAITYKFGDTPTDLSCSVNDEATKRFRTAVSKPQNTVDYTTKKISNQLRSDTDKTWIMNCSGGGHSSELAVGKGADGSVRVSQVGMP
jgi:hypothetical protein